MQEKSFMTGTLDIDYKIFENNKIDIYLGINIQEILGSPTIESSTSEIYGINLKIGKKIYN